MAEQVIVPFAGDGAGTGELSWGQQKVWQALQEEVGLGIGGAFPLPPGTNVSDLAADMGYLLGRHPSLRTRLLPREGAPPQQVAAAAGEATMAVVDAGARDPAEVADAVYREYHGREFDYAGEWPIRWAAVCRDGEATHLVSEISHLATDGQGALVLTADMAARPRAGGASVPVTIDPESAAPPLEQARWQASPQGRRHSQAALRYWENLLRAIPARRYPDSPDKRVPRYWDAYLDSPALYLALRAVAGRAEVSTSTVLLSAAAVSFARVTGADLAVVRVEVDNRFRRGFAGSVSPVAQPGLFAIDVRGTFGDVVARTFRATISAYKYGYYDPLAMSALLARIRAERGEELDISCYINDRRFESRHEAAVTVPAAGDIAEALPRTVFRFGPPRTENGGRCFLHVFAEPASIHFCLCSDTHYVSPGGQKAYLRGLESAVVEAALAPEPR